MTRKKDTDIEENVTTDETEVLDENSLLCLLTNEPKKDKDQERTLQSLIRMMDEEYGFSLADMERDFTVAGEDESGKKWRRKVDLVIFEEGSEHKQENIIRLCIVMDGKVKETDAKKGAKATLEPALGAADCEFGLWTNGNRTFFCRKKKPPSTRFSLTSPTSPAQAKRSPASTAATKPSCAALPTTA